MKCNNPNCENYQKETITIAMYQINDTESMVYEWDEVHGLGRNLDSQYGELPSEHDRNPNRKIPYIYQIECRYCGEELILFD